MTIAMQGSWTVSVKSKEAAWPQRFRIAGSSNGVDGVYSHTSPPLFVSGPQWGVTVEYDSPGAVGWSQSRHRMRNFRVSGGQFLFDIETDDSAGDQDFDDLILTCAMTQAASEYVVYGTVKTYSGSCLFNPCYPHPYFVIDYPWQLTELLKNAETRRIIEKLYPERVKKPAVGPGPWPGPGPDPTPFRPLMIPTGLADDAGLVVNRTAATVAATAEMQTAGRKVAAKKVAPATAAVDTAAVGTAVYAMSTAAPVVESILNRQELLLLARLKDLVRVRPCSVQAVTQTIMRFFEYDRTAAEKLGDPYSGEGNRHLLGSAATDEFGTYLFRFSFDYAQMVEEGSDIAPGEDPLVQGRPDLIIQLLETLPDGVMYESAPYYNIPNVRKIDLCLPSSAIGVPRTSCQGGRAIQALGNLSIITSGTTLHSDGTVSNSNVTGPLVSHAAWYGTVDLYACFLDTEPAVSHYVIRYRRHDPDSGWGTWNFVNAGYSHPKKQGDGTWQNEVIGPLPVSLRVNGPAQPKVVVGAYLNIEDQVTAQEWQNWNRDRKLQINTALFQPLSGQVEFRIEGYNAAGEKVAGGEDTIRLFIDNTWTNGDIESIRLGVEDPGECAYFQLPTAGAPLAVRFRATDTEGFMASYALNVYRGSNTSVPTRNQATGLSVAASYQPVAPFRFRGTLEETLNPSGYVEINLEPTAGSWLASGVDFCAFSFELSAVDRKTNGYGTPSGRTLWRELVGIAYEWPDGTP
jgi:hypothetical protein